MYYTTVEQLFFPPKLKRYILLREGVVSFQHLPCPVIPNSFMRHLLETFPQDGFSGDNGMKLGGGGDDSGLEANQNNGSSRSGVSQPFSSICCTLPLCSVIMGITSFNPHSNPMK